MITLLRTSDCHGRSDSHYSRIVCTRCCRAGSPSARAPTTLTARSAAAESPPLAAEGILSTSRWETRTCTSARLSPSTTRASPIGAALSARHHHLWHTTTPAHQQNSCACVRLALRFPHTCELAVCTCGVCARAGCVHVQGGGARKLPERAGACARGAADSRVDRTGGHRLLRAPERHAICRLIIRLALPLSLSVCFKHSVFSYIGSIRSTVGHQQLMLQARLCWSTVRRRLFLTRSAASRLSGESVKETVGTVLPQCGDCVDAYG